MRNFGLRDLVLVDPIADPKAHEARMLATNGVEILDAVRIVPTFFDAVHDCGYVLATGGETLGTRRETTRGNPAYVLPGLLAALPHGPTAIVFGPEPHGLTTDEIGRCHALMHLPTDPEYASLNLAMSVGLSLYELRNAIVASEGSPGVDLSRSRVPAQFADFDRAMNHLDDAMRNLHFLFGQNADSLMHAFRHLVGRAQPTTQEVNMLHGLARQLRYAADQMHQAEEIRKRGSV